jgi:hypothetical protein
LISTAVSVQTCGRCKDTVLAAWTDGVFVLADLAAVSGVGEYVALASGRPSFVLRHGEMVERTSYRMELDGPVVLKHICGDPPKILAAPGGGARQSRYVLDPDGPIPF